MRYHFKDVAMKTIELNSVDLRFEHTRHKNADIERRLLSSIMDQDILEPLRISVCKDTQRPVLLDGFKRYRCARKLNKGIIPVEYIGEDVVDGVLCLLRRESVSGLNILEQAGMIEELHQTYSLSIYDIATGLGRSPSWVSMRLGMIGELSALVRGKIMSGAFPARAYMYGIKGFTRVNKISAECVDSFVEAVSGKGINTRDLIMLSKAYFTGGKTTVQLILEGDTHRAIKMLACKAGVGSTRGTTLTEVQHSFVADLEIIAKSMGRIVGSGVAKNSMTPLYMHEVNIWSATICKNLKVFSTIIRELYDYSGRTDNRFDALEPGNQPQENSAVGTH
jgi:hypothetical protein